MREAAHRILYTVSQSNAMNGYDSDTRVILITPWWQKALLAFNVTFGILGCAGVAGYIVLECFEKFGKKKECAACAKEITEEQVQ